MNFGNDSIDKYLSKVRPLYYQSIFRSVSAYVGGSTESYQSVTQRILTIHDAKLRAALIAIAANKAGFVSTYDMNLAINAASNRQYIHILRAVTSGAASVSVTPVLSASLTSAVAPFGVVFDGVSSTATSGDAFHDYVYYFDFGDGAAANYTYGQLAGTTKNRFVGGPVAAYVYETAGSYTARMWVSDGVSVWGPVSQTITVTNPDTVYPTTQTVVVSSSGNFAGKPTGAFEVTSSDFDATFTTHKGSNKRILFRAGETFDASVASLGSGGMTNLFIGTFGGAGYATVNATANNIQILAGVANGSNPANNPSGWRVTGIHFTRGVAVTGGTAFGVGVIADSADKTNVTKGYCTVHDCKVSKLNGGIYPNGIGVVVSKLVTENINEGVFGSAGVSVFPVDALKLGIIDCSLNNDYGGEHVIRTQGLQTAAIISNRLQRPCSGKHYITIRGYGYVAPSYDTKHVVVSSNFIDGSTSTVPVSYQCQVNPQQATAYEPITHVLWENNFHYTVSTQQFVTVEAYNTLFRNNVFYAETGTISGSVFALSTNTSGLPPTNNIMMYNNTVYLNVPSGNASFVVETATTLNSKTFGNLMYAPNITNDEYGATGGPNIWSTRATGTGRTTGNNSSDAQNKSTNPLWVGPATTQAGYKLQSGSYAKDTGVNVKVRTDALNFLRVGANFDMGALNAPDKQVDAWTIIP